jgi:hypothetical protein
METHDDHKGVPPKSSYARGFTVRSFLVSLFGIVTCTALVQFFECVEGSDAGFGGHALVIPALWIVIAFILASGLCFALARFRLLTRAELLVTLFALSLATPLTSSGFWTMMIGAIGTIPKTADFETYDAWPPKLWPHGPNLIENVFREANRSSLITEGTVVWREIEYEERRAVSIPVLENAGPQDRASVRIRVPVASKTNAEGIVPGEPYLLTVLLRPEDLGPESVYFCRVYYDKGDAAASGSRDTHFALEPFTSRAPGERTLLHRTGFTRRGMYGLTVSETAGSTALIEFGLSGRGRLALADAELMDVGTLDSIYRGRRLISHAALDRLGQIPTTELLVKPERWLSVEGAKFILASYVPWEDWAVPFAAWTSFAFLCLIGAFCIAILMRRQWIDSERYPLPLTRIPLALLGDEETPARALPPIWANRMMWMGFVIALFWCLMRIWHRYNSDVPDMGIEVQMTPYFTSPMWGKMWYGQDVRNVTFTVTALFVSIAIFMELNVLMSLFLGFFLFRGEYWFGEASGWALKKDFPFFQQQQVGAYIAYALLILFFARKHLWRILCRACSGPFSDRETLGYRAALLTLGLSVAGILGWSHWVGIPVGGVLVFFAFLMMVALVAIKLRCECGTPFSGFTPVNLAMVLPLAGGMLFFGPAGVIFVVFANWIVFQRVFFVLPGMQFELLELGRRFRILPRHVAYTVLLGAVGGLVIGGWAFLSMGYAVGGDNYSQRWPYMDKGFLISDYNTEMARAKTVRASTPGLTDAGEATAWTQAASIGAPALGYIFAAAVTTVLVILRQVFTGFWFHPIGFVVGSTVLMEYIWGSVLVAFVIRAVTLKIGGAVVVREKLLPFFVGVFLASLAAYFIVGIINAYLFYFHPSIIREALVF